MGGNPRNEQIAGVLFRSRLLDEPTLRRALAEAGERDLGDFLVASGRARAEDLARVLGRPSFSAQQTRDDSLPESAGANTILTPSPGVAGGAGSTVASSQLLSQAAAPSQRFGLGAALSAKPGDEIAGGTRLGPYVLKRLIAKGGMGAVFEAEHERLGRTVALKVLLAGEAASEEQIERFLTEARMASRLAHPNVVPIYEVGAEGTAHFLTMELVDGPSLRSVIKKKGSLEPRRALTILEQVARGVAAAHEQGIVHRDLKPENVLLARSGEGEVAKVMDFGLAKDTGAQGKGLTVTGQVLGTPSYMAPEQAAGEPTGPPADVYGLGAILYECLTGKPPFEGPTLANIITSVLTKDPVAPRVLRPALNRDVETICLRALEKEPRKRYESASAMADDAARWLAGESIRARPATRRERATRWVRRNRALVAGSSLGLTLALGTAGWFVVSAELAKRSALAALEAAAAAFDDRVEKERVRAGELERAITDEPSTREAASLAARKASSSLEAEWTRLGAEAQRLVRATRPFLDADAADAGYLLALGRRQDGVGKVDSALDSFAGAYATAPVSAAGRAALAEAAARREGPVSLEVLSHLLRTRLDPATERVVRLARARRFASAGNLGDAAADLAALEREPDTSSDRRIVEDARRLSSFVRPLVRFQDLDCVAARRARVVPAKAGAPARLYVTEVSGAGRIFAFDAATHRLALERTVPPPPLEPGDGFIDTAIGGPPDAPLVAGFTGSHRVVVAGADGKLLCPPIPRRAWQLGGLDFLDLGDPETSALACIIRWNDGDSLLLRIDRQGRIREELLDAEGMNRVGGRIYGLACGPLGGGPRRVVLGYGIPQRSPRIRVLQDDRKALVECPGAEVEVQGHDVGLALVDVEGDGKLALAVGGAYDDRDAAKAGAAREGLNVYACEGDRIQRPCRLRVEVDDGKTRPQDARSRLEADFARRGGETWALTRWACVSETGALLRVARLGKGGVEPLVALPIPSIESWPIVATGDLDSDGEDEVVVKGPRGLRVLGLRQGETAPATPAAKPIDDEKARSVVVDFLTRLGFQGRALEFVRRREAGTGATGETEEIAISLLRVEEARVGWPSPSDAFVSKAQAFLGEPDRSSSGAARAHLLVAHHFARSIDPEIFRLALLEVAKVIKAELPVAEVADLERIERLIVVRATPGASPPGMLEVPFVFSGEPPPAHPVRRVLASDPVRVRLDPERGLVAQVNKRAEFFAGIPVSVTPGMHRMAVDFTTEGRAWGAQFEVGLFREAGRGLVDASPVGEGLVCQGGLWSPGAFSSGFGPGFGCSYTGGERWPIFTLLQPPPAEHAFDVGPPLCHRAKLRAVLEQDTWTHACRYTLVDRASSRILVDYECHSPLALAPGPYIAGLRSLGVQGDYAGSNMPPDATVALERITLAQVPLLGASCFPGETIVQGNEAAIAGGKALLAAASRGPLEEARKAYDAAIATSTSARVPWLLVQRADMRARRGDAASARADIERALDADLLETFCALEADGRQLDDATARVLRELLRDALAANDARLAAAPDEVALLERRACIQRLRGELQDVRATLGRAEELAKKTGSGPSALRAYLAVSASGGTEEERDALGRFPRPGRPVPEFFTVLRTFWLPREPVSDLEAHIKEQLGKPLSWGLKEVWLSRWAELRPARAAPWKTRALWVNGGGHPDKGIRWRVTTDLRRVVELDPRDSESAALLGAYEALAYDYASAVEHLRAARRLGADLAPLLGSIEKTLAKDDPEGWAALEKALKE